jgi:hypothetical protein
MYHDGVVWNKFIISFDHVLVPFNFSYLKQRHNSTASDDKTVDHTLHSYEDLQDMEDEHHHYLQIITPEEDATCTKDNSS